MTYVLTSNSLSLSHGDSPLDRRDIPKCGFKRGFIIYITGQRKNSGYSEIINTRVYYYDYDPQNSSEKDTIKNIYSLERKVIKHARKHGANQSVSTNVRPFPALMSRSLNILNFGWEPCDISYILDYPGWEFQPVRDQIRSFNINISPLNQPVVFRKDKIIFCKETKEYKIMNYDYNKSFYNLKVRNKNDISYLRISNFMLDQKGNLIQYIHDNIQHWQYCMDMHIRITQSSKKRILANFGEKLGNDILSLLSHNKIDLTDSINADSELPDFLTIVFDPPQCNGGGSGPPRIS